MARLRDLIGTASDQPSLYGFGVQYILEGMQALGNIRATVWDVSDPMLRDIVRVMDAPRRLSWVRTVRGADRPSPEANRKEWGP